MTQQRPWVRGELPWLRGPLYRVQSDAWPLVDTYLRQWNYLRVELDGRAMTSDREAHAELHRAFGFPKWCGHSWDAFDDCFGDYVEEHDGAHVAVIWLHLEAAARQAPQPPPWWAGLCSSARPVSCHPSHPGPRGLWLWTSSLSATGRTSTPRADHPEMPSAGRRFQAVGLCLPCPSAEVSRASQEQINGVGHLAATRATSFRRTSGCPSGCTTLPRGARSPFSRGSDGPWVGSR